MTHRPGPRLQRPPAATAVENQANASVTVPFGDGAVGHRVDDRAGRGDRRARPSGMTPMASVLPVAATRGVSERERGEDQVSPPTMRAPPRQAPHR
jgi:hypothetical protein